MSHLHDRHRSGSRTLRRLLRAACLVSDVPRETEERLIEGAPYFTGPLTFRIILGGLVSPARYLPFAAVRSLGHADSRRLHYCDTNARIGYPCETWRQERPFGARMSRCSSTLFAAILVEGRLAGRFSQVMVGLTPTTSSSARTKCAQRRCGSATGWQTDYRQPRSRAEKSVRRRLALQYGNLEQLFDCGMRGNSSGHASFLRDQLDGFNKRRHHQARTRTDAGGLSWPMFVTRRTTRARHAVPPSQHVPTERLEIAKRTLTPVLNSNTLEPQQMGKLRRLKEWRRVGSSLA